MQSLLFCFWGMVWGGVGRGAWGGNITKLIIYCEYLVQNFSLVLCKIDVCLLCKVICPILKKFG